MSAGGTGRRWEITDAVRKNHPSPKDGGLNGTQRWVMIDLLHRADTTTGLIPDRYQPTLDELANTTGLGTGALKRAITALRKAGWIETSRPNLRKSARYVLTIPAGLSESTANPLSQSTANPLSESTTDPLDVTGDRSESATTPLSESTTNPSEPTTDSQSVRNGLTSTSPFSESSPTAAPAAAPDLADRNDDAAVADVMRRIDVTEPEARRGIAHLRADRSTEVRNMRGLLGSISDDELRERVADGLRQDDDHRRDRELREAADEEARRHFCQVCEAEPGEPCIYPDTGGPMPSVHGPRRVAVERPTEHRPVDRGDIDRPGLRPDDPLFYTCPTCDVPPGQTCNKKGGSKKQPHQKRIDLAQEQAA